MRAMRKLLLLGGACAALAGCGTAGQMPQQSGTPQYYGPSPYVDPRPAPSPYPYAPPVRPRRYAPPAGDDAVPDQAQLVPSPVAPPVSRPSPPAQPSRPSLVPMDPDCGWWDPCHLWMGAGT
jgi:hypothetical protein